MAITARGAGAVVAGTGGALSPAFPATIAAGDAAWINWHAKPETVTAPTITGWTKVMDRVSGGGTGGAGTGPTRQAVYRKDGDCAGTEGGTTVSVPAVTGANMNQASIFAVNKTLTGWDIAYTAGDQTTAATAVSITESPAEHETSGDLMAMAVSAATNTNLGSQTVNATGATFGTATEHVDTGTANGDDGRLGWVSRPVTGGPATAASVYSGTATAAETVGVVFLRIRETSGATTHDIAATGTGTSTGSAELLLAPGALSASGSGATAGSADLGVTLALSATGVGQTGGSADLTIVGGSTTHLLAALGSGSSTGSLAANLKLTLSSTGSGVSGGSLALGSVLTLGSTGIGQTAGSAALSILGPATIHQLAATGAGQTSGSLAITVIEPTYFFSPPTHEEPIRVGVDMPSRPLGYFRMTYAASVVKVGGAWTTIRTPSAELLRGLVDGVDFFRGGYEYQIGRDIAAELEAAGLMSMPSFGYGMGAYGAGPYGD